MARSLSIGGWDLLRPLDVLSSVWSSAAALPPVSSGAAVAYRTLFMTVKRVVVGRTLNLRLDSGEMTLTVTEFDSRLDVRRLAVGQLNDVRLAAADIRWEKRNFTAATLVLHNVHVRPGVLPVLVAAPVEVMLEMPSDALDAVFRSFFPRLTGQVDDDGVARLRLSRRPALGSLEVGVAVDGTRLWLHPRAVALRGRRWRLPRRVPSYPVELPELAGGLTLTGLSFGPQSVRLSGSLPEWRAEVPLIREHYAQFGDRLPAKLAAEVDDLEARLA